MSHDLCELGVIGLTTIGQSLAAHHASNKTRVCVADDDPTFVPQVIDEYKTQIEAGEEDSDPLPRASRCMLPSDTMEELVARLSSPRKIIIFGTHANDQKFEDIWNKLCPVLESGDMILRWGKEEDNDNSVQFYNDSIVRNLSKTQGQIREIHLVEMVRMERDRTVVFEGETPEVFLVGGPHEAYVQLEAYISPCATIVHAGNDAGCAHYAHMIQRVIENGVTQAIAEGSDILSKAARHEQQDIGRIMNNWNAGGGRLASYLLRITAKIYYKRDNMTKKGFVIDHILDSVDLSAVDTWVTLEATKLGIPAPTINATLESRFLSVMKDERVEASRILKVPESADTPSVMKDQISEDVESAIYCACVCLVSECLAIFQAASRAESWDANIADCIKVWNQPGSFLESNLLEKIYSSLVNNDDELKNLMIVPDIASELQELHMSWRRIVTLSFASAIPCPTMSSSLTYYDTYRSRRLPTSLIRAQCDFFDASGYNRLGQEGWYSTCWITEHTKEKKMKEGEVETEGEETPKKGEKSPPKKKRKKSGSIDKSMAIDVSEAFDESMAYDNCEAI